MWYKDYKTLQWGNIVCSSMVLWHVWDVSLRSSFSRKPLLVLRPGFRFPIQSRKSLANNPVAIFSTFVQAQQLYTWHGCSGIPSGCGIVVSTTAYLLLF